MQPTRPTSRPSTRRRRGAPAASTRSIVTLALSLCVAIAAYIYLTSVETGGPSLAPAIAREIGPALPRGADRRIAALEEEDHRQLGNQRRFVDELARRHIGSSISGSSLDDLRVIQELLDMELFEPDQTYELQALGVALGDVMVARLGLRWVVFEDRVARSRALQLGDTDTFIFPVTMISKRVERSVPFKVRELFLKAARTVADSKRA